MPAPAQTSRPPRPIQLALLDACRGGAALWVVMAHACLAYIALGHEELLSNPLYAFSVCGQIGVGFFFAISGYCILATIFNALIRGGTIRGYLAARCRRIYPPYLIALGCFVLLHLTILFLMSKGIFANARPPESPLSHGLGYWLANVSLVQLPTGYTSFMFVSWSLCYEIAFYMVAGCLWGLCAGGGRKMAQPVVLVSLLNLCSLLSVVWVAASKNTCPFPMDRWYQFGLGIAMFVLVNKKELQLGRFLQLQSITVILAVLAHALNQTSERMPNLYHSERAQLFCVLGFVVVVTVLARFDHVFASNRIVVRLRQLGTISYSLYLIHMIPIPLVDALLRRVGLQGPLYLVNYTVQTVTAVIAGIVFHRLVERRFFETRQRPVEAVSMQCQTALTTSGTASL